MSQLPVIEKDLTEWNPRLWILLILALAALQVSALYFASGSVRARTQYPEQPKFEFARYSQQRSFEPANDPMLFAAANRNGFSGSAWMQSESQEQNFFQNLPSPTFLTFADAHKIFEKKPEPRPLRDYHVPPELPRNELASSPRSSALRVEGEVRPRKLVLRLPLPPEVYNDVLGSSVVEVAVDPDGIVVSARLSESSGLKKADQDAVAYARLARFEPSQTASSRDPAQLQFGKLIFEWFALDFSSTNAVTR
jgi:TonB family protein